MANTLLTNYQKLNPARNFLSQISVNDNFYYFFTSNHDTTANTDDLFDTTGITVVSTYRNMIQGKLIANTDVRPVIRRVDYETNKIFAMYDDQDETLFSKDYYAVVNSGSFYHVFKVLDNNLGAQSTVQPDFAHITGANTTLYQTADGYRWKYLYTISQQVANDFGTTHYFPVSSNTEVVSSAVKGAVDIILVEDGGRGYDNYLLGTFQSVDLRVNGNLSLHALSSTNASTVNGFYTGCLLYISSGAGIGEYRTITDYICNENGNFIVTNTSLTTTQNGSQYQIFPGVEITGDGFQSVNAVARAMVNATSSNSIYRIEMLQRGQQYSYLRANVVANAVVNVDEAASIRPIYGPKAGHGYDPASELPFEGLGFNIVLANSESNTLLTSGAYQTIGIIHKPRFSNVTIEFTNSVGTFQSSEIVHALNPIRIGVGEVNTSCTLITFSNADIQATLPANTLLYLQSSAGDEHELARLSSTVNTTCLDVTANLSFACTTTFVYLANSISEFRCESQLDSTHLRAGNVAGHFSAADLIVGNTSGAVASVNTITRCGVTKGFETFIQLVKIEATSPTGTWQPPEGIWAANGTKTAMLHSVVNVGPDQILYVSNTVGSFAANDVLTGNTSGATATITDVYCPELVFGSGSVIYAENTPNAITRSEHQTETFKLYLKL